MALVSVPAALGLALMAEPLCATLFQYGQFTGGDTRMVAASVIAMSVGVPAFMLSKVLLPAFYSRQDTRTPMRAAVITVFVNVVLTVLLVTPLWYWGFHAAHGGIALATALAGIVNAGLLWRYLIRQGVYRAQQGWPRLFLQIALGSGLMVATVVYARYTVGDWSGLGPWYLRAAWLLGVVGAGALAYGLGLLIAGVRPRHLREA